MKPATLRTRESWVLLKGTMNLWWQESGQSALRKGEGQSECPKAGTESRCANTGHSPHPQQCPDLGKPLQGALKAWLCVFPVGSFTLSVPQALSLNKLDYCLHWILRAKCREVATSFFSSFILRAGRSRCLCVLSGWWMHGDEDRPRSLPGALEGAWNIDKLPWLFEAISPSPAVHPWGLGSNLAPCWLPFLSTGRCCGW